jgi:NAD(P)-dependent dehydrogenase (short-subunit alcohol dehydrogenase family)
VSDGRIGLPTSPRPDVVLVTGCSSGIGKACSDHLTEAGRRVYGASRTPCAPQRWRYVAMDVTDDASVQRAVGAVMAQEGRIDALVHCAGVSLAGAVEDATVEEAKRQFDTNFFGTVRVLRAVLPVMRQQASGRILIIGSIGGLIGLPFLGHYSASKFALNGLVEALRIEVAPLGIEACVVHPGDYCTAISANQMVSANAGNNSAYTDACRRTVSIYDEGVRQAPPPEVVARRIERLLSRRRLPVRSVLGSPVEVAAVWLKAVLPARIFEALVRKAYRL